MRNRKSRGGVYIHVPYCRRKCIYCDFFSGGERIAEWEAFTAALLNELKSRMEEVPAIVDTIYIGGGTPSVMPDGKFLEFSHSLMKILEGNRRIPSEGIMEYTIEANPEDVDNRKADLWLKGGVNRVSLGIESFDDRFLKAMGRRHSGKEAEEAFRLIYRRFPESNLDLIYGLPGQRIDDWESDLRKALSLNPTHLSLYSLMYEVGTALSVLRDKGKITECAEETSLAMFNRAKLLLEKEGIIRYEISNYAREGHESVHNSGYWSGMPYIGLGPSACGYDGERVRTSNPADIRKYISRYAEGADNGYTPERETLSDRELIEEYLLTRLRRRKGFRTDDFRARFPEMFSPGIADRIEKLREDDLLDVSYGKNGIESVALSEKGVMLSDKIILELSLECEKTEN